MPLRRIFSTIVVAMVLVFSGAFQAEAGTVYTWHGAYSNDWGDFSNWDQSIYPNGSDAIAVIDNFGSVGYTVDFYTSVSVGELEIGLTDTLTLYGPSDMTFVRLDGLTDPVITNNGEIRLYATGDYAYLVADDPDVLLTGAGTVVLGNQLYSTLAASGSGRFINNELHTIRGQGRITAPIKNDGLILADDGTISISGPVDNTNGIIRASSPGRISLFDRVEGGSIDPGDGVIDLKSGEIADVTIEAGLVEVTSQPIFKGGNTNHATIRISDGVFPASHELSFDDSEGAPILDNQGIIELQSPNGNIQTLNSPSTTTKTTLTGSGKVLMGVLDKCRMTGGAGFINGFSHTIEGAGDLAAPIENKGVIRAVNGTLEIQAPITGDGQIIVDNGELNIASADVETHAFSMLPAAVLNVGANRSLDVDGNFTFEQTDEAKWSWAAGSTLGMSPGLTKYLEVGGEDRGADASGFSNNFNLENLVVQSGGTLIVLTDSVDNGNRHSLEALYVGALQVLPGATLDLNGIRLYTHKDGAPYLVCHGDGALFGGGVIENSALCTYSMTIAIPSGGGSVQDNVGVTCPADCARDYVENTSVPFTAIPDAGWTFVRWDGDLSGFVNNPAVITWTSNMDIEAVFAPLPSTWRLDVVAPDPAKGSVTGPGIGCPQICQATFNDADVVALTANPANGYEFIEWGGDLTGASNNPAYITMDADKQVSAVFAATSVVTLTTSLSLVSGGVVTGSGISCPGDCAETFQKGATATLVASPSPGYEFIRWDGDLAGVTGNPVSVTMHTDKNVTAVFGPSPSGATLTTSLSPGGGGSVIGDGINCPGDCKETFEKGSATTIAATPNPGYEFVRWDGDLAGVMDNPADVTMNSDKHVTAVFARIESRRTLVAAVAPADGGVVTGSGIDCPGDCEETFDDGARVELAATPAGGFLFSHWTGDLDGSDNPAALDMDADKSVTAVFVPIRYTLEVEISPEGGGSVTGSGLDCPGDCDASFEKGAVTTLSATPNPGWEFIRWDGDLAGAADNPADVTMNSNKSVAAVFALIESTRTLVAAVAPADGGVVTGSGVDCPGDCEETFDDGARVELAATPAEGFLFSRWTGDLDGSDNPAALDMDADKSVTAVFVPTRYTLEVEISPGGGGTVTNGVIDCPDGCVGEYDADAEATLLAMPARGFRFGHWEGALQGSSSTASLIMDGDKKVVAVFIPVTHALTLSGVPAGAGFISTPRGKCPVNCEQIYAPDALVDLEAVPTPGHLFDHWELDLTGPGNPAEIQMDSDKEVRAIFIVNEGNLPPEEPEGLFPGDNAFIEGSSATLKAGPFMDPENDAHVLTRWKIRRADMGYGRSYYDPSFDHVAEAGDELTEYTVSGLLPCLKYAWKVGYMDFGSGRITWSREHVFFIDASETTEEMRIQGGIGDEDFSMVSFGVWPLDPSSEHVFGDDMTGGRYGQDYLIGAYNPLVGGYVQFGPGLPIIPGRAYWILSRFLFHVTVTGTPSCLDSVIETPLVFSGGDGWNMIGCPASVDYPWREVRVIVYDDNGGILFGPAAIYELPEDNPYIDTRLLGFRNGAYFDERIMKRNEGYWVRARRVNVALLYHTLFVWGQGPRNGERWETTAGQGGKRIKEGTFTTPGVPIREGDMPPGPPRPRD